MSKGFTQWLEEEQPDVVCLQETKAQPDQIPTLEFEALGYRSYFFSAKKKGYSGVAILTRVEPDHVEYGMGIPAYDDEGRALRENTLNIMDIIENKEALLRMDEFIADQQLNVKRAQDRMEEVRLVLQTAMQESKTQEKLREKAFEQFVKEENAKESKEIDELVSYTYGRKA